MCLDRPIFVARTTLEREGSIRCVSVHIQKDTAPTRQQVRRLVHAVPPNPLTFGFEDPAKPALIDELPLSMIMG
jgi:hypothetical protein